MPQELAEIIGLAVGMTIWLGENCRFIISDINDIGMKYAFSPKRPRTKVVMPLLFGAKLLIFS
jgi:hypothetical protein